MKSFIKLLFILFVVFLTLSFDAPTECVQTVDYIQNSDYKTIEMVSNSLRPSEVFANEGDESQNYAGNSPEALLVSFKDNSLLKNNSVFYGRFIHNLSTNQNNVKNIRAP